MQFLFEQDFFPFVMNIFFHLFCSHEKKISLIYSDVYSCLLRGLRSQQVNSTNSTRENACTKSGEMAVFHVFHVFELLIFPFRKRLFVLNFLCSSAFLLFYFLLMLYMKLEAFLWLPTRHLSTRDQLTQNLNNRSPAFNYKQISNRILSYRTTKIAMQNILKEKLQWLHRIFKQ